MWRIVQIVTITIAATVAPTIVGFPKNKPVNEKVIPTQMHVLGVNTV